MSGRELSTSAEAQLVIWGATIIGVLGMKTEDQQSEPAFYVPEYLLKQGKRIVPIPVYFPEASQILELPVYRRVVDAPPLDLLVVFRRPESLMAHLADILAAKPKAVWLQSGIRNEAFATALREADIDVVQSRCAMVDLRAAIVSRS